MRQALKIILGTAGAWMPMRFLISISGQKLILPFYHAVSDNPMPHIAEVYPVRSLKSFRRDLEFLLKHFEPVGLDALVSHTSNKRSKPAMLLSFDDGLAEVYDFVAPVLLAKGVPAAFFVNTDFVDNKGLFYRYKSSLLLERFEKINYSPAITELLESRYHLASSRKKCVREFLLNITYANRNELDEIAKLVDLDFNTFLQIRKPYMDMEQLRALAGQGFYIGAHSKDHPPFADISPTERLHQFRESMEYVRKELGTSYGIFSFPFTDNGVPAGFFSEIRSKDMPGLDASFGTAGLKNEPVSFHHQRIPMESGRVSARRLIRGEYLYYLAKTPFGKNEIKRI